MENEVLDYCKENVFVNTTVSVCMSKSMCFEVPEDYEVKDLEETAKKEIPTPDKVIEMLSNILRQHGIIVNVANGWVLDDLAVTVE